MPQPETSHRFQWIVVWFATGTPDKFGQARVTDVPVEMQVRFDNSFREVPDGQGGTITIEASAQLGPNDPDVPVKSVVWQGRLRDLQVGTAFAFDDGSLLTVEFFNRVPDIRNRASFREITMSRYKGVLPSLKVS